MSFDQFPYLQNHSNLHFKDDGYKDEYQLTIQDLKEFIFQNLN